MSLNLYLRYGNGSMFQYLVPITKNISINTFSCKTSRESITWETLTWKCVNGVDKTGTGLSPTAGFCGHSNKFWSSHFMTERLLPSSPECKPDQTMRKESVPPVFQLSCAPTPTTIINHTGAHPCSRHSKVGPWLNCVNQRQLSNVGSQHTVTFRSINLRPDVAVVTAECLVGQK
jgi:hypothetical protein